MENILKVGLYAFFFLEVTGMKKKDYMIDKIYVSMRFYENMALNVLKIITAVYRLRERSLSCSL